MKRISIEEMKRIQLDMLKDIDSFCKANNITYFLAYGTLLGAVRHKGYIPWDDDIDICMPRPDYERFVFSYINRNQNYQIKEFRKNKEYGFPFAKVSNENTIMNEYMYDADSNGVYIDVFPLDGFKEKIQLIKFQWLNKFLNSKKAVLGKNRSLKKNVLIALGKIVLFPLSIHFLLKKMHKIATRYGYLESENVAIFCFSTLKKGVVPRSVFETVDTAVFENIKVNAPHDFDRYLTSLYGNYMALPPVEQRVTHHAFEAWWKE